jgi:hypothetical protein
MVADKSPAPNARQYPRWAQGYLFWPLYLPVPFQPWSVGVGVFLAYWGVPFLFAAKEKTLVSSEAIQRLTDPVHGFPILQPLAKVLLAGPATLQQPYLLDYAHLLFAALLATGAAAAVSIIRSVSTILPALHKSGPLETEAHNTEALYRQFQSIANHWIPRVVSLFLAVSTLYTFMILWKIKAFEYWWGSSAYGFAGVVLAFLEFVVVFYVTQTLYFMAVASIMFRHVLLRGLRLRPFHPGGCNGLAPLGKLIFQLWLFSLTIAAAVFVVLGIGYLGLERWTLSWMLSVVATVSLPFLAIVPLHASLRAIHKTRNAAVGRLEPVLNEIFHSVGTVENATTLAEKSDAISRLNELKNVHDLITGANLWPFNPRALALVVIVYFAQLAITVYGLFQ